ncbi:MAG: hypothetical protein KDJ45_06320 [Hyphomicrobiaceae bacterium]|nr:hypothetical protein [Hyphomicrobiaceae bacterium]MCC0009284.1 hypothetical protein [Hyphomicrobiaceae bacterium]
MFRIFGLAVTMAIVSGCASSSSDIQAAYVSPLQYDNLTCSQLGAEAERVSARAAQVSGVQDQKSTNDAVATGVAIVLFWPAAFFIKGDGPTATELARLKGEFETIEKVSIHKNCNLQFRRQTQPSA